MFGTSNFYTKLWTSAPKVNFDTKLGSNVKFGTTLRTCAEVILEICAKVTVPKFIRAELRLPGKEQLR